LEEHPNFEDDWPIQIRVSAMNRHDFGSGVTIAVEDDPKGLPAGLASALNEFFGSAPDNKYLADWLDEWTERQVQDALNRLEDTIAEEQGA